MRRYQILTLIFIIIFLFNLALLVSRRTAPKPKNDHTHTPIVMNHKDESDEHLDPPPITSQQPPLVSIIIPLYNQIRYIQDAVDSVVNQGFDELEIVIVDDGSTEWSTRSVLNNMKELYPGKVVVVFKTNGGLSDARNAGIKVARGEWVLPLDADDLLDPTFLTKAMQLIQTNPSTNLVISDLMGVDADDPSQFVSEWRIPEWDLQELPKKNLLHCCPLFKRDLWLATDGYSPSMVFGWEDWEFWIRANAQIPLVPAVIHERLFKYRIKPGMHSFCKDYYNLCFAMLQTMHPELYPTEDVLHAHKIIVQHQKMVEQPIRNKLASFCDTVALHMWTGLLKEASGNINDALLDYDQAQRLTSAEIDWQPQFLIAFAKQKQGSIDESKHMFDNLFALFPGLRESAEKVYGAVE